MVEDGDEKEKIEDASEERGRQASIDGFAHEHIVLGILMKKYGNVSLVDLPLSFFDILVVFKNSEGRENFIRCQVKTATKSISFGGGSRGGKDRTYKAGIKTYTQNRNTSDVVIGFHAEEEGIVNNELYFVPTLLIERMKQKSLSINKAKCLKNNYAILENCKDKKYVMEFVDRNCPDILKD